MQVSTFIYGLFCSGTIEKVLIVVPLAVLDNWVRELAAWAPKVRVVQYHGTPAQRREALKKIYNRGGVALTTYGTTQYPRLFRFVLLINYHSDTAAKNVEHLTEKTNEEGQSKTVEWDIVVLDEGHKIKNPSTKTAKAINAIGARTRLVLTGTPLMNNLKVRL